MTAPDPARRPAPAADAVPWQQASPGSGRAEPAGPGIGVLVPIAPSTPGNGLAHRARAWLRAAAQVGRVVTVLVPTHGPAVAGDHHLVPLVAPRAADHRLPPRAAQAPEGHGRWWARGRPPLDLIVALGADLGPFALGVAAAMGGAPVVVDLDDDLVSFHRSRGDLDAADRYGLVVDEIRRRADAVASVAGFGGSVPIPNAVALPASAPRFLRSGPPEVLMVGNHGYPPNAEGARCFLADVWPRVLAAVPDARLTLAGPGSEALDHGVGLVADLAPRYRAATVAVVPLLHGSGSRIKALEAFAHGVAVVGTTIGLDGLAITHERDCLVADDAPAFAAAVVRLLRDRPLGAALAAAAHDLVRRRYDARAIEQEAAGLLAQVLAAPRVLALRRGSHLVVQPDADGLRVADTVAGVDHHLDPATAAIFQLAARGSTVEAITEAVGRTAGPERASSVVPDVVGRLLAVGLLLAEPAGPGSDPGIRARSEPPGR